MNSNGDTQIAGNFLPVSGNGFPVSFLPNGNAFAPGLGFFGQPQQNG